VAQLGKFHGVPCQLEAQFQAVNDDAVALGTALDEGFQSIDRRLKEFGPVQPERFSLEEANVRLSELAQRWRVRP
jgi:hypothetical protein